MPDQAGGFIVVTEDDARYFPNATEYSVDDRGNLTLTTGTRNLATYAWEDWGRVEAYGEGQTGNRQG